MSCEYELRRYVTNVSYVDMSISTSTSVYKEGFRLRVVCFFFLSHATSCIIILRFYFPPVSGVVCPASPVLCPLFPAFARSAFGRPVRHSSCPTFARPVRHPSRPTFASPRPALILSDVCSSPSSARPCPQTHPSTLDFHSRFRRRYTRLHQIRPTYSR